MAEDTVPPTEPQQDATNAEEDATEAAETAANAAEDATNAEEDATEAEETAANAAEATADAEEATDDLPACGVAVEDAGTLKKKVTVTVPRERITAKFDEMYGELGHSAQIPGFRIGHAPRRLVEKRFGREVGKDVRNGIIGESIGQAMKQAELSTLGEPEMDLEAIELPDNGDLAYSFEVEVAPEFDLPETKGIPVDKPALEVTDEQIDEHVERFRMSRAKFEPTDNPAAVGDLVSVDVVLTAEGCDDVKREDLSLRVGPGQIEGLAIVELGDALVGKAAGETAAVKATAATVHPHEPWRDKEVTATLTIKQVTARILPELNDEFAEQVGFDSLDDLRKFISAQLAGNLAAETQRAMRNQICQHLLDAVQFDLPEGVVARHTQRALQRRYVDLLQRGIPREQIDENLTELQADAATQATTELKLTFILGKVADAAEVEVSEDEINSHIARMAAQYNRRPERLRQELTQDGTIEQVAIAIREQKALDKLLEDAVVTEVSAEELAAKADAQRKQAEDDAKADTGEIAAEREQKKAKKTTKQAAANKPAKKPEAKKTEKKAAKKTAKSKTRRSSKSEGGKAAKKTARKSAKKAGGKSD